MSTDGLLKLRDQVTFDELTGVMRRVAGVAAVEREIHRARRHRTPLAVVFVDVDGLKRTNDTKGHVAGDQLLKNVARVLAERLRGHDIVFRYGGDEFVCVLPECTGDDAEQNLSGIRDAALNQGFSFSCGVAQLEPHDDIVSLLGRADGLLYQGRRRRADGSRGDAPPIRLRPRSTQQSRATV